MGGGASTVKSKAPNNHEDEKGITEKGKAKANIKEISRSSTNSIPSELSSTNEKVSENQNILEGSCGDPADTRFANNKLKRLVKYC